MSEFRQMLPTDVLKFAVVKEEKNHAVFKDQIIEISRLCGITVTNMHWKESENSVSLYEQLVTMIHVEGTCNIVNRQVPSQFYTEFRKCWTKSVPKIVPDEFNRPWLNLGSDLAFKRKFKNAHKNIGITNLCVGTLTSYSSFFSHYEQIAEKVTFYHDSRKILINNQLEISYFSIKDILVNNLQWTIHFSHPPVMFREKKRVFEIDYLDNKTIGRCNALLISFINEKEMDEVLSRLHYCCKSLALNIVFVPVTKTGRTMPSAIPSFTFEAFEVKYLIEAILRRSFILELQGLDQFIDEVRNLFQKNKIVLVKVLKELIYMMDYGSIFQFKPALKLQFHNEINTKSINVMELVPEKTKLVRRAIITPSRILLYPPELVITNRIVRKFDIDFSLRISFRDESLNKFSHSGKYNCTEIIEKIVGEVHHGLNIANRWYEFLGWSNSQIRDHGMWLYARDLNDYTATYIQRWMGDFSQIRVVAKYAARMGQSFSQTEEAVLVPLNEGRVFTEDDIKAKEIDPESHTPYVFSDGVGKISLSLAEKVCKVLQVEKIRCAFQIRYSGYKGMLVIDPNLKDHDIVFRQSMKKFECPSSQTLEIVKIAQACNATLNRPFVTILDQMHIKHSTFLKVQDEALQSYTDMFLNDDKAAAYLSMHNNMVKVPFKDFVSSGVYPTVEPFFHSMLLAGHKFDIAQIMKKARIPINPEDGRNMFGVLDETGTLNYGEVFVQYTTHLLGQETNLDTTILKGKVLVTKNPCYQQGDVRILKAIDVPTLHHIIDCIVFPQKGKRPHPNEMSGSDLDGDEYTVIWKEDFIFARNARPRHCPVPEKIDIGRPVSTSDLLRFFSMFIVNDRIGPLASAHLAAADKVGLHNQLCTKLARNCSIAVDFSKSGVPTESTEHMSVTYYPDFMEKWDKMMYRSNRVLGKLYRRCRVYSRLNPRWDAHYQNVQVDPLLVYPGWEKYESSAVESRNKYNCFLESIVTNYGVVAESEAMTGMYSRLNGRFSVKNGRNEVEELIQILIRSLWKCMKEDFYEEFDPELLLSKHVELLKKASAWYVVTYRENMPKFLSFPWINSGFLLDIKYGAILDGLLTVESVILELECMVETALDRVERLPSRKDKDFILAKAKVLLEMWCNCNYFNLTQVLKLFSAAMPSEEYAESISYMFNFFKYIVCLSLQEDLTQTNIVNLSNEAMYSYQRIAVKKDLACFGLSQKYAEIDKVEMDPRIMSQDVIENCDLKYLTNFLHVNSGVDSVDGRLEDGKILISAVGTADKVEKLEDLIREGSASLKNEFRP